MSEIITDLGLQGQDLKDMVSWLKNEQEYEKMCHEARMELVKQDHEGMNERNVDGLGQCIGEIDLLTYCRWQQMDADFWNDTKNVKKFINENPMYRVNNKRV